ncbi:hypothetical protein [Geodermatophilus amargosae]|uniref:hypothetical protein n=1 Tax=Geodermatophilus amargosae TaxID=1296565 RepID=UPI0034DE2EC8
MSLRVHAVAGFLRLTAKPRRTTAERARQRMADPGRPAPLPDALRRRHDVRTR